MRKVRFPEVLSTGDVTDSICPERNSKIRSVCHYIDNDFDCRDEVTNKNV